MVIEKISLSIYADLRMTIKRVTDLEKYRSSQQERKKNNTNNWNAEINVMFNERRHTRERTLSQPISIVIVISTVRKFEIPAVLSLQLRLLTNTK